MFSYIYMKILESQPKRYDRGIRWLSLGHADAFKRRIVEEYVREGSSLLEIGTGTGSFAVMAARKSANVLAFDISPGMLEVARKKIESEKLEHRVELREMGVALMDKLDAGSFDLVVANLVFSELSPDERSYTLHQAFRLLRQDGRLVIADETKPKSPMKRFLYHTVRVPLMLFTFALTQTTTSPVIGIEELVTSEGFRIERIERSSMGSFFCLTALKESSE